MPSFALAPEVIPLLCQALMAGIAGAYVLSLPRKTRAARWLVVLFAGNTLFAVAYMLAMMTLASAAWAVRFNMGLYVGVGVAGLAAVRISYTFLARPFRREGRVALGLAAGALAVLLGLTAYAAITLDVRWFGPSLAGFGAYLLATSVWAMSVHLRQARRFRRLALYGPRWRSQRAAAGGHVAMAGLMALMLVLAAINALATADVIAIEAIQFWSLVLEMVIGVGLIVVFINHAPEPTTVQAKVVGVTLGSVLLLLGLAGLALLRPAEMAEAAGNVVPAEITVRFAPDGEGYRVVREGAVAPVPGGATVEVDPEGRTARLPFDVRLGGRVYREVVVARRPFLAVGAPEPCTEVCLGAAAVPAPHHPLVLPFLGVFNGEVSEPPTVTATATRADATWDVLGIDGARSEHRATLFADGTVEIAYRGPRRHPRAGSAGLHLGGDARVAHFAWEAPAALPAGVGLVDPYGARFTALSNARVGRVVPIVLGAALFVIVLLPWSLQRGVLRPLGSLLRGMDRVDRGERNVHVDMRANDELGTLARRFNAMTASLATAEAGLRRYAVALEDRVAERTRDLRAANADLAQKRDELAASLAELRAAQDRLVQAEKMASLGRLTSGIAHEIKNPLNFVTNFAGLSRDAVEDLRDALADGEDAEARELLDTLAFNAEKIEEHGARADRIVQGMQLHARGALGHRTATDLNDLLRLAAEGVARAYASRTGGDGAPPVELDLGPGVGEVPVVPEGVLQVAASLLDNALYASARGQARTPVRLSSRRTNGTVEVCVADAGPGMDAETAAHVFEPFFTTKPPGEGTGLGLSLAYDIVTAGHGGEIDLDTAPGEGTTFTVRLPAEV